MALKFDFVLSFCELIMGSKMGLEAIEKTVIDRAIGRATWYFVDEFHLLLKEEQTAAYSAEIGKRFRKRAAFPPERP